jgi:hypothetical protein
MGVDPQNEARERLAAVIAESSSAFARYAFRHPLQVCRCGVCVQPEEEALLLKTPVAEMPASLLQVYTESAHSSSPVADEQFRALLPRYFELCAMGDWPAHSVEITFRRLVDANARRKWPAAEIAILERFFVTLFETWLQDRGELGRTDADAMLCLPVYAGGRIEPLLAVWAADTSLASALKLADFVLSLNWGKRKNWLGAFWEDHQAEQDTVMAWLRSPEAYLLLDTALAATVDFGEQRRLNDAALLL